MNWLLKLTPIVAALSLTLACGDDDDDDDDGGGSTECTGTYTGWTEAELEAEISSSGACAGEAAAICANDFSNSAGECGTACFMATPTDEPAQLVCTLDCMKEEVDAPPSDECLGCYIAAVACARENCLTPCLQDPSGDECVMCRDEEGCTSGFFTCSGLPAPSSGSM